MCSDGIIRSLTVFLEEKGVSLEEYGSGEFGLERDDAIVFLGLLAKADKLPSGIEVWRRRAKDNELRMDSLGGWYREEEDRDIDVIRRSAREFLDVVSLADGDVVTIQFSRTNKG